MTTIITALLADLWPYIVAGIGGLLLILQQRRAGAAKERQKQAGRDIKAKDELLEMHREADEAERDAARLSDEEARRRALEWARKN